MNTTIQMGTSVEIDVPMKLRDIIEMQPELKALSDGGIIQKVFLSAKCGDAVHIRVTYVPKLHKQEKEGVKE